MFVGILVASPGEICRSPSGILVYSLAPREPGESVTSSIVWNPDGIYSDEDRPCDDRKATKYEYEEPKEANKEIGIQPILSNLRDQIPNEDNS